MAATNSADDPRLQRARVEESKREQARSCWGGRRRKGTAAPIVFVNFSALLKQNARTSLIESYKPLQRDTSTGSAALLTTSLCQAADGKFFHFDLD